MRLGRISIKVFSKILLGLIEKVEKILGDFWLYKVRCVW